VPEEDYPEGIVECLRSVETALQEAENMLEYLLRRIPDAEGPIKAVFARQLGSMQAMGRVAHHMSDVLEENFEARRKEARDAQS